MKNKRYSRGEELSNTLSHGAGTLLGITAGYFLLEKALANPHPYWATGCVLAYLVGMLASYISSTWYHGSRPGKRKELLRKFDHGAIYLHIAGDLHSVHPVSATPCRRMGLGNLHFCMAVGYCRIHISLQKLKEHSNLETICFVGMGSAILVAPQTTNGLPVRHRGLSRLLVASRRRSFVYHGSRVLLVAKTLYARRFPPVLSRRKHRPYHSHLVDSLANPIRFFSPKFPVLENFLYQEERKVLQKFLLKQEQLIVLTVTFVADFSTKKRFSHKGTLCKSATVPAAVILSENPHTMPLRPAWEGVARER